MNGCLVVLGILNYITVALYTLITIVFDRNIAVTEFLTDMAILLACLNICGMIVSRIKAELLCCHENEDNFSGGIDLTVNDEEELRNILKEAIREDEESFDEIRLENLNNTN